MLDYIATEKVYEGVEGGKVMMEGKGKKLVVVVGSVTLRVCTVWG